MIATLPTQDQVDQLAAELAPDVVRIRVDIGRDWSDDPAVYFRVTLADEATQNGRLPTTARSVRDIIWNRFGFGSSDHIPYVRFRSQSEQAKIQDPAWA